jgi:hypothetical protein
MRRCSLLAAGFVMLASATTATAGPKEDAYSTVERWASEFNAANVDKLVSLYTPDALFFGTTMQTLATTPEAVRKYFAGVAMIAPKVKLGDHSMMMISDTAVLDAGSYEFTREKDGQTMIVPARYSILLVKKGNDWGIAHHHSSARPAPPPQ